MPTSKREPTQQPPAASHQQFAHHPKNAPRALRARELRRGFARLLRGHIAAPHSRHATRLKTSLRRRSLRWVAAQCEQLTDPTASRLLVVPVRPFVRSYVCSFVCRSASRRLNSRACKHRARHAQHFGDRSFADRLQLTAYNARRRRRRRFHTTARHPRASHQLVYV